MKTLKIFISIFILLIFSQPIFSQKGYNINVIMIGIGGKNPTFDESKYQNLTFYYTPELVSQAKLGKEAKSALSVFSGGASREIFEGKPDILAKWWDNRDLRNYALLFDKNGVGTWQGKLDIEDNLVEDSKGEGDESDLENTFENLLEDDEVTELDKDKKFDYEDDDSIIETLMPNFKVTALDSSQISIRQLIKKGKPTMVVFFQISKDVDLNAAKKEVKKDKGIGEFFGSAVQTMAGNDWKTLMENIEFYIFGKKVDTKFKG